MSTEEVQQRVNQLRRQKLHELEDKLEKDRNAKEAIMYMVVEQEKERNDAFINCEAETIFFLEELTDSKIIADFSEDKEPETYVAGVCSKIPNFLNYNACLCIITNGQSCKNIEWNKKCNYCKYYTSYTNYTNMINCITYRNNIQKKPTEHEYNLKKDIYIFKIKFIQKYILNIINSIYQERLRLRKEKAIQEEQIKRERIIESINSNVKYKVQNAEHAFTNLTMSDWDTRHDKQFIYYNNQFGWSHLRVDMQPCYTGMPSSFANYYEDGKVPFFTKCPTCKSPTKFNYLNTKYQSGWGDCEHNNSCNFKEVYCDKHYFYDSCTNKHYIANNSGQPIHINRPKEGSWIVFCWNPSNGKPQTKWKEWDPSDPDGSNAVAEKKKKQIEEVQQQITALQAKLAGLK